MPKWLTRLFRREVSTVYAVRVVIDAAGRLVRISNRNLSRTQALSQFNSLLMNDVSNHILAMAVTRDDQVVREYSPWKY